MTAEYKICTLCNASGWLILPTVSNGGGKKCTMCDNQKIIHKITEKPPLMDKYSKEYARIMGDVIIEQLKIDNENAIKNKELEKRTSI